MDEIQRTPDPRRQAKSARNRILVERRRRGETYARIAADHGISAERVRQIVQKATGSEDVDRYSGLHVLVDRD